MPKLVPQEKYCNQEREKLKVGRNKQYAEIALQKVRPQRESRNNIVQEYQNTKNKFEKESINKNVVTRETAQLFGRHTKAQRQTAQKTRWAHGASKIMTEDRLE